MLPDSPTPPADTDTSPIEGGPQRRRPRDKTGPLVYVNLDQGNAGVIHDLNQDGTAIQAKGHLQVQQQVQLRFELLNPRTRVDTMDEVTWANASGQVGVSFTQIGQQTRNQLKEWLVIVLWANFSNSSSGSSIFRAANQDKRDSELISSTDVQAGNTPHTGTPSVVPPLHSVPSQKPVRRFLTPRSVESSCTDVNHIGKLIVMLVFPEAYRKLHETVLAVTAVYVCAQPSPRGNRSPLRLLDRN